MDWRKARVLRKSRPSRLGDCGELAGPPTAMAPATAGRPGHGEAELELAFETAVAEEMRIDGAVGDGQAQAREEKVLELYPKMLDIQFFAFHGRS